MKALLLRLKRKYDLTIKKMAKLPADATTDRAMLGIAALKLRREIAEINGELDEDNPEDQQT